MRADGTWAASLGGLTSSEPVSRNDFHSLTIRLTTKQLDILCHQRTLHLIIVHFFVACFVISISVGRILAQSPPSTEQLETLSS